MKKRMTRRVELLLGHLVTVLIVAILAGGLFLASRACAATLTMSLDQPTYEVGAPIFLIVTGDPQGATASSGIFARLAFDTSIRFEGSLTLSPPTTDGVPWTSRALCQDGLETYWVDPYTGGHYRYGDIWAYNPPGNDWGTPFTLDQPLVKQIVLRATQPGDFVLHWDPHFEYSYQFFGESLGQYTTTVRVVPEPGTGWLVALGLLAIVGRRR